MVNINIYILDRNLNICNTLSSNGDVNSSPFFNDVYKQVLETGVETFEFESMQLDYLENCNYVAFEYKGDLKLFQISEIEDTHEDNLVKRVYCEMAGIELTYEIIRPRMIQSANIRQFLEILLSDTSWNVGYIDEDITDVFTIEISDFEKIYDVIQENIKLFECEIVFRVEKENGIFKKYIDAYKSRGDITNYRFEYSKNIQGISRTVNSFELVTALIGVGKDDLTFKSCEWSKSNGDPIDKPKGQDYIVDESAFRLYNNNGSHLMGYYKCDLDTPYDLLNATYKELKERNTPKVDYEVDITLIDDEANIGDTVYVIDNDWQPTPLHLSARISQLEISFTDKTKNKCTLSNYNRVKSKIKDDLNEILNRIPEDTSFMGISKGGLLSSSIEANGYRLQIKNKLTDKNGKEYFFRLKDKTSTSFMNNILTKDPKYVTQSFAIDFDESCIYTTQSITETDPHHILITKMNFTGDILGYMRLHGFGHGSQIGIDKIDGVTKIWCECEGRPHTDTGRLYGTKICRFEFVDGAEYTNSTGSVYDIIPNARNIQVAISEETNRLSVKYITYDNKNGFKVFDLRSVLNNRPRVLASFLIPNWLEDSINPNQGHSVYENRIYHYQGGDSQSAEARITVLDFRGNVLDSNIIKDGIGFTNREPEGLYLRCNNGIYELYAGISEGAWPNRKYHIYKYYEGLGSEYEKRGTFIHNNGHSTDIYETIIDTNLDGTARRKEYLIYSSNKTSQFIIGSFKNGSWWVNNELYTPEVNDAIIAELIESDNAMEIILLTNDFESIKGENGQDGSPGQDAVFLELTNEFHSVPTDADGNGGIYAGCETELRLYKGDVQLTDNISYSIKNTSNITGKLDGDKYTVTNLTKDTGYVDLVATYFGKEYIKRFSLSKNKQGLGGEDGLTPTVYWLMTSTSTISKDSKGNLKPSSVTFWAKSQTGEDSVVNYQGIFKIYESIDGNIFTLKHTSELDDTVPYTPSSTAQSIKCELYLNDGVTLIDQDIVNIVKDGTDGFSGADAKYVLLTGEQIFKYTNNFTGTPTPSSITLTGTPFNISSSNAKWYYKKSSDTNYTLISANNGKMEFTLNHNDSTLFANNNKVVTIKFDIDGYYDEMTIAKISDGSSGSDGEDGYFVLLTNENHTVPCENDGTVVNGELEKAKTEIHVFKGTQEVSFSLSKTDVGCTSTYDSSTKTLSITSLTSKAATVTMQITVNGTVFTKVMTISKATKGDTGEDSYTVDMTNDNYSFNCDAKGNIASVITTTTVITAFKGVNPVVPTIGTLPTVAGLTLSKSNGIITIKANTGTSLADNGSFDIPVTVGGNNFIKTFSWTKVKNGSNGSNGVSVTSTDVEYAQNTSSTTAPTTGWTTTAPTWQNGKYIWSRTKTVLSDGTTKYTNPACITGQQGNSGVGVSSIVEYYKVHTSNTGVTNATSGFTTTIPTMTETNKYLWNYELITYTNNTTEKTTARVIGMYSKDGTNGTNGSDGKGIKSIVNYYLASASGSGVTTGTSGWTTTIQNVSTSKKYLWNYEVINYTTGSPTTTSPVIIGVYGDTGATGTGISSITEEYYLSTSKTTQTGGSWVTTPPTWSTGKYMWTRSKIVYNNPTSTVYTTPICDSSWEAVNDMEIGVRNLLKGSNKAYTNINISQWNGTVSRWRRKHCSEFGLQAGDTITFSVKIRPINKSKLRARIDFYSESSGEVGKTTYANSEIIFKGEEKVSSVTATIPKDKEYITLYIQNADTVNDTTVTSEQYMHDILTKGNKVVGWTPAPEDVDNAIGNNLKTVDVMYYLSTSQTSLTGGSWQTTAPTWVNGKYMWSKTVTTLANGTTKESSPTCIAGAKGDTGSAGKGVKSIVEQYYLSTSQTSLSGGSWSTTVPTWQQGKYIWTRSVITYTDNTTTTTNGICVSGSKGDKGDAGTNGTNGVNGTSPVLVTITGQQSMKYLDKTTAPTPSTITLTANVMEGNVVVSSGITYIWQYKNSSGTWVNLSGTYTSKTYSLAHNNTGFVNEVAQIRVAVSYKSKTYYLEHTVTKIYDNKYISKQEVFDKITEGGTNQLIYKDPSTGEIYINATFIKTGQLVADLIKGGILTLGGTGNSDTGDYGRFRILDSTGQNELASMDGGEMRMVNLQAEELNATDLNVKNINCATYAPAIYEYTKVYVNTTSGNDDVEFESGAIFKTLQGALDSAPKNLNGFTTEIVLQTAVSENIVIRGFSGGTLNILMNSKNINGYVVARDCSAQVFILGGLTTTDIPDGINNTGLRPNIQPSQLFSFGGYNYSFVAIGCPFVYVRSVDIFGKTGTTTNYCGGSVNGSNVYVQNVNAYASNSGWNVTTGGKMTTKETYGRCERLAYNVQLGGVAHICNGNSTGAPSNIYTGNGGQVIQGNVTFVGSGDVGSNNNTTTNNTSIVLNANYGDSYKVKYSSWRKDNSVRQGDWSSTGMNKGCWFFGNQFADLKGKTIKSVKLTLQRQSGGNSGAVAFTLKMHNHTGRPSGAPSYLSGWSKNVSLSVGQSTTITITDSAVLTAIKNGTMKGFGIEASSTSNSYYGILTPKLKAVVTY